MGRGQGHDARPAELGRRAGIPWRDQRGSAFEQLGVSRAVRSSIKVIPASTVVRTAAEARGLWWLVDRPELPLLGSAAQSGNGRDTCGHHRPFFVKRQASRAVRFIPPHARCAVPACTVRPAPRAAAKSHRRCGEWPGPGRWCPASAYLHIRAGNAAADP